MGHHKRRNHVKRVTALGMLRTTVLHTFQENSKVRAGLEGWLGGLRALADLTEDQSSAKGLTLSSGIQSLAHSWHIPTQTTNIHVNKKQSLQVRKS